MSYGLYISAEGAHAQTTRLEVISHNLANVDTVGFKRELAVVQARYAEAIEQGTVTPDSGEIEDLGGGVFILETRTDHSPGPVRRTGVPTDVAITGRGFFAVERDNETLLTRAGNFQLDSRGQLVTQQGYPVLSDTGAPIYLLPENGPATISEDGIIRQRGISQRLGLVEPGSPEELTRIGENLFRPLNTPEAVSDEDRHFASEHLEQSGVKPTTAMIELIEASRILEMNINMMKSQDEMTESLVSRVLRV
jgi:flagellar basal-body rod protein FlgF/flagellar basal-body rod protein FlgG